MRSIVNRYEWFVAEGPGANMFYETREIINTPGRKYTYRYKQEQLFSKYVTP